jgi:hypothetical protein
MLEDAMPAKAGGLVPGSAENWADGESLEFKIGASGGAIDGGDGRLIGSSSDDARSGRSRKFIAGLAGKGKLDASRTEPNRTYHNGSFAT